MSDRTPFSHATMSGSPLPGQAKKSLRRKPPPPMNPAISDLPVRPGPQPLADPAEQYSSPFVLQPAHPDAVTTLRPVHWLSSRSGDLDSPTLRIDPAAEADSDSRDQPYDLSYAEAEELFLSYESPKPKGPQELPFEPYAPMSASSLYYDEDSSLQPDSPIGRDLSAVDRLAGPLLLSPPLLSGMSASSRRKSYPPRRYQNLLQKGTSPFELLDSEDGDPTQSMPSLPQSSTVLTLPYPVQELLSDGEEDASLQLRSAAFGTPTKIPPLVDQISMQQGDSPEYAFVRSSPSHLARYSSSPELPNHSFSQLSSPTKNSLYRRLTHTYSNYVSENRSSRSPSPKKSFGSSPSLPKSGYYPTEDYEMNMFDEELKENRIPRWSLIEHDDYDDYDDGLTTPYTTHFDYSILPELPKLAESTLDRDLTMKSLFTKDYNFLQTAPTIRKKNADLPPVPLDLPALPFSSSSLSRLHFAACRNVWSLSAIYEWCLKLNGWLHDEKLPQKEFRKALIKLLVFHKRDIPVDLIGRNATQIVSTFISAGVILLDETSGTKADQLLLFVPGTISGVLVDLTACYCGDEDHMGGETKTEKKCYSSQCLINKMIEHEIRMKNTDIHSIVLGTDWASHWKLTAEDMSMDPGVSKRQSLLFDLIKFEQTFIQRAQCFVTIVGPEFIRSAKLLVGPNAIVLMSKFEDDILTPAKELASVHQSSLFEPLLTILISDGKLIRNVKEIGNLYASWARSVRSALLRYMSTVPMIEDLLSYETLKRWDETLRNNPRVKELQVNGNMLLMSTFNSRYQQLPLQLLDIRKSFDEEDEEYILLTKAVDAIKRLGNKVNEMKVHADNIHSLKLVAKQLTWKSNVFQPNLLLNSEKRKFFYRGDLVRKGELKINSSNVHMIVLDNYVLITERQKNQRSFTYKVTETPIPMDYLIVEIRDKESPTTLSVRSEATEGDENSMTYPFKIRYAGMGRGETHTLVANSEHDRKRWFTILLQAKANLVKRVSQVTPFELRLLDNSFFAYDQVNRVTKLPILPANDPVLGLASTTIPNLASRGLSKDVYSANVPRNLFVFKKIQCSEMFNYLHTTFHFVGLSSGVYCSDERNMWKRIINMNNVTKLTVVPEFNVVLVLASKNLRYYPLQLLIDVYYERKEKISSFQLSNEAILFYEFGRHKGVPTVFVAKKKNAGTTTFKVFGLEVDNNGILSTFLVIKRFYIQAECYGISIFNTSVAVHTQRGFEVLDLNKLSPRTIPELPTSESTSKKIDAFGRKKSSLSTDVIKKAIAPTSVKPLGMYKLESNNEFLLVYSGCAIFVNRSGSLSRMSLMRFDFRPTSIAFVANNLFLVCEEVIEVWSVSNFANGTNRLIQVIPNKDIHMTNAQALTFVVANPKVQGLQLLFQMNEKTKSEREQK